MAIRILYNLILFGIIIETLKLSGCVLINESSITQGHQLHKRRHPNKFTINELLNSKFEHKISNDIDLDPCKAGGFMGDIALPDLQFDNFNENPKQYNKTFQQELEILKQEVYNEGLQVEEEGLTDIIRRKTKLPSTVNGRLNERNRNDPSISANEPVKILELNRNKNLKSGAVTQINVIYPENQITTTKLTTVTSSTTSISTSPRMDVPIEKQTQLPIRNIDHRKIQSNTKDIIDISGNNFIADKKFVILSTVSPTYRSTLPNVFSNAGGNGEKFDDIEILSADGTFKKKLRHRRQRRRSNRHSKEYQRKLQHLKDELNRPIISVEELRKKSWEKKQEIFSKNKRKDLKKLSKIHSKVSEKKNERTGNLLKVNSFEVRHRSARAVTAKKERIWDYGVIPYEIDGNFSGNHKALFKQAMRHWENFTCIKFVERDPVIHPNYIIFTVRNCGCCSFVGKRGNGGQAISIGRNCDKFGIVVHELGHVVGFWHEHTRPDREKHVTIELSNIMKGQDYNFNMLTSDDVDSLGMPYDYDSIMHYARNTFSKGTYLDTILPIEIKGRKRPEIGQRVRLSSGDISQANLLYKCPKCGRTFQENSGHFTSPTYSLTNFINETEKCEWRITATHGERIILHIENLNLLKSENCQTDYLEIRDGYWFKSPIIQRFCGKVSSQNITTNSSRMLLTYVNSHRSSGYRGFRADFQAICGGELNIDIDGRLESPNYPLEYLPNKDCIWKIHVPPEYQVALKFQSFEVENHDNCAYDYVEVRDGNRSDSKLIGVFCGYKPPPNMKSTSNSMFVKFVSDGSVQKAGFSAIFMKEVDECETQDHGCEHECINTLGGYKCSCHIGYELHSDKKHCEDACGGIIEDSNGTITSPSFPDYYPILKECIWEIIAPPRYKISINFTHFDLEGHNHQHVDCGFDHVTVFSKLGENRLKRIGTYCGSKLPPLLTSEGNVLRIEFNSDKSIQGSGFAAVFFTDIDECATNNGNCQHECKNTIGSYICSCHNGYSLHDNGHDCKEGECKHEITAPYGNIYSPNYPGLYPPNLDCVWHFSTTPGHRIKLIFNDFNIESHQECAYDHVIIYDGESEENHTLGRLCGDKMPHPISASSNEMYMVLKTDKNKQGKGFAATHSTSCGGYLRATNNLNHIYSHAKHGYQNYNIKTECDWIIQAAQGSNVQLTFLTFDIEDNENCTYDYVEVYAGMDDSSGPLYGRYCGNNNPPEIISLTDSLLVRFKTDDSMTKKGFSASYVVVDPFENSEEMSSDSSEMITPFPGYLKSIYKTTSDEYDDYACGGYLRATNNLNHIYSHAKHGYQNYNIKTECDWIIQAAQGSNVQLTFLTFDIEDNENCTYDYVEVYAGMDDSSGPLYGRYCGNSNPPEIISLTDSLLVRFKTDDSMTKKGFSASYVVVDPFENSEEMSSDSSEMITPFPGYLKSIYKTTSDEYDDYGDYSENHLIFNNRKRKNRKYNNF